MAIPDSSLRALLDISREINSIRELASLMEKILDIALRFLDAERGYILLQEINSASLTPVASKNIDPRRSNDLSEISASTVEKVIKTLKPLLAFDTQGDTGYDPSHSVILQKIASIACVPLLLKGKLIGVIYIDSREKTAGFTQQSMDFLNAFANQAAIAIENVRLTEKLQNENELLKGEFHRIFAFEDLIGSTKVMQNVFEIMGRVLNNDVTILLTGETGTGKEVVARSIHQNGNRKENNFVAINCAVIPENLIESELFGHKKGSFTGAISDKQGLVEKADNGTLFLDEIGDLNLQMQVKLLRFLQEKTYTPVGDTEQKKVSVRIITATNRDLAEQVKKGNFREDLFYRLNVLNIHLPPLRDRKKDIPLLVRHFLKKYAEHSATAVKSISKEAAQVLENYNWPGNVRELENVLERSMVFCTGKEIKAEHITLTGIEKANSIEAGMKLDELSKELLEKTLQACNGNKTKAAKMMGVSLRWIHYHTNSSSKT
jgi:Nif-specific regulatory protein